MKQYEVLIIGAGAAGLGAAKTAVILGKKVAVLDFAHTPARKISLSGGGRCNFTNTAADYTKYFGSNRNFTRSALQQFTPTDALKWAESHNLTFNQKKPGQYFCNQGAVAIVEALLQDSQKADFFFESDISKIDKEQDVFCVQTNKGLFKSKSLIIATGSLAFPSVSVSDFGFRIAKQFGHKIVPARPALCPIVVKNFDSSLAGISLPVEISVEKEKIYDDLLFTHFGFGGPAIYRATVRDIQNGIAINFAPGTDVFELLKGAKKSSGKKLIKTVLSEIIPAKLADFFTDKMLKNIADYKDSELKTIADKVNKFFLSKETFKLYGMQSAEVARGGVSVDDISSKTMESKLCSGLFFAGEVLDIAGDLGGFNLQWAWSSGYVAGLNA